MVAIVEADADDFWGTWNGSKEDDAGEGFGGGGGDTAEVGVDVGSGSSAAGDDAECIGEAGRLKAEDLIIDDDTGKSEFAGGHEGNEAHAASVIRGASNGRSGRCLLAIVAWGHQLGKSEA